MPLFIVAQLCLWNKIYKGGKHYYKEYMKEQPIKNISVETLECLKCKRNARDVIFLPCKHLVLCRDCVDRMYGWEIKCMKCRRKVVDKKYIYVN